MSLGCDFMRDFLLALQEMLKGSVGGCGNVGIFTFCSLEVWETPLKACVIAYQQSSWWAVGG